MNRKAETWIGTWLLGISTILSIGLTHSALIGALFYNSGMIEVSHLGGGEQGDGATLALRADRALEWLHKSRQWQAARERIDWVEGRLRTIQDAAIRQAAGQRLWGLLEQAEDLREAGGVQEAVALYQEALEINSHLVPAYVGLIHAYTELGQSQKVEELKQRLISLTPMIAVGQEAAPGWKLRGHDLYSEAALDFGAPLWVALYWETTKPGLVHKIKQRNDWQTYAIDKAVYQFGMARNLVFDGGLEQFTALALPVSEPLNWPNRIYSVDEKQLHLWVAVERDGRMTHVIRMDNVAGPNSATLSRRFPVTGGQLYLQGGRVRSASRSGECRLGRRWEPHERQSDPSYLFQGDDKGWGTYAGLTIAPRWAEEAVIVLLTRGSGQTCEYDDLFMTPVSLPVLVDSNR